MKKIAVIIMISITLQSLWAGGVGTTGANYLKIGLGAKATAMADSFTALADDTSAAYWNAAGLSKATSSQVDFMQLNWIAGISAKTFMGVQPLSDTDFIGGYFFMLDTPQDKETKYDTAAPGNAGYETGDKFNDSIKVLNISYSKKISSTLSAGLGLKAISEDLAGNKASGFGVDAGLLYNGLLPDLTLGMSVQNIALNKLRSDEDLPMSTAFGAAYTMNLWEKKLNLMTDLKIPNDNDPRYSVGGEYWLSKIFAARVGYNTFSKFALGMGVNVENLVADYAYVPMGDLGVTHRFSVGYKFDSLAAVDNVEEELVLPSVEVKPEELFQEPAAVTPQADLVSVDAATEDLIQKLEF